MFRGWGFLLGEIWVLIALAALIGLGIGWLIWGRRGADDSGEAAGLRADLAACEARARDCGQRMARLEQELATALAAQAAPVDEDPVAATASSTETDKEPAPDAAPAPEDVGTKPATLEAARGGQPDDLKRIKGIGPKVEQLCNRLGFYHFDQIAAWTDDEIAWVDANLETFKGRVTRDDWVAQARVLAAEAQD